VAAKLRSELGVDVETAHGHYGEYRILVDGETVIDGGAGVKLGLVPSSRKSIEAVRARLGL